MLKDGKITPEEKDYLLTSKRFKEAMAASPLPKRVEMLRRLLAATDKTPGKDGKTTLRMTLANASKSYERGRGFFDPEGLWPDFMANNVAIGRLKEINLSLDEGIMLIETYQALERGTT